MKKLYSQIYHSIRFKLFFISILLTNAVAAQINVPSLPFSYSQGFSSYAGTTASLPAGWSASATASLVQGNINTGSSNTGAIYAYGTGGEYALGALRSGTTGNITYTVTFRNNTPSTITSLTLSWNYEQWRFANTSGLDCSGTGALAGNAILNAKDFTGTTSGSAGASTPVTSFTLTGLSIAANATFGISWVTTDGASSDNGVAIDDFNMDIAATCISPTITPAAAPSSQAVCQNSTPAPLAIGATGTPPIAYQWYSNIINSNSGGTSVGAANGGQTTSYVPPTTIAGTVYYYCVVTGCSANIPSGALTVIVSVPSSATISYPGTPFCSNAGIKTVTGTGTPGGTYSAPAGLNINSSNGDINPALSTAGTYTVTYTMPAAGGCASQFTTTAVTITALPAATISYSAASFCKTAGIHNINTTGTAGGTYAASPAGLTINSASGAITPSSSIEGNYIVTYMMAAPGNGCSVDQTTTTTVAIGSTATSISPVAIQDLSINNDGTTLSVNEGATPVSRQWKYSTTPGGPYTQNLGSASTQIPNFPLTGIYYVVCVSTYPAVPCGASVVTSNEVRINVNNNTIITAPALYGPFCNNASNSIAVNFTYSPVASFPNGNAVFTAQLSNANGSFALPVNIETVVSNGSGSQSIAATIPSGIAGGFAFRVRLISNNPNSIGTDNDNDFIIGGFPSATIDYTGSPICSSAGVQSVTLTGTSGGSYSSTAGLIIDGSTGAITPSISTPATYLVTYYMPAAGTCPAQSTITSVIISALPAATISYTGSPFCGNGAVQNVTISGTNGGTYTSTAGLSINNSTGAINPALSTPGTYVVTYTMIASGCTNQRASTSVTITQAPSATIAYTGSPFCSNDFTTKAVTKTGVSGGTYSSSPTGLSINASTGDIAIFGSTPGTYIVTYTLNSVGGCSFQTATATVTINNAPLVSNIAGATTITLPGTSSLSNATPGGAWSSSNNAIATVNTAGLVTGVAYGTAIINYTINSGGCSNVASTAVNVITAGGVDLWTNSITDAGNPSSSNPYITGQVINGNISVSGIRYTGVSSAVATDRYNTSGWNVPSIDLNKYISFILTPDAGYAIDFKSFTYTGEASAGTGPTGIAVRSSIDGYSTDIPTATILGTTIVLTGAAYQNIINPIQFRVYSYGAASSAGEYSINDFTFRGNLRVLCTSPTAIEFITQPMLVTQSEVMPSVLVRAKCNDGNVGAGYTGPVVLSAYNGCGYVSQTVNAVAGIATFSNIIFNRSAQAAIRLQAFAAGFTPVISDTFSVIAPSGIPVTDILVNENFEGSTAWPYTVSNDIVAGSGGTAGVGVVTKKTFSGNQSLVKSYSVNNSSGNLGSTNTITFANQTIASVYNSVTFNFKLASLGSGSGAGNDTGEPMYIEISTDGGTVWNRLLTYNGFSNLLFNFSALPVYTLANGANVTYPSPTASSFSVSVSGISQFRFRVTATNNRTEENWAIDDILLTATKAASLGIANPLPTITSASIISCPNTNKTITVLTGNTVGVVSYVWSPPVNINNTTVSNPVVNPPAAATYSVNITDADGCKASGTVSITMPGGTAGTWVGTNNSDWFQCGNWGAGVVPDNTINATIPGTALNVAEIDPLSAFAGGFGGIARVNNIVIDNKIVRLQANANMNIAGNLTIQNNGTIDMATGGQIDLNGTWTNNVGAAGFTAGTGTINYTGSSTLTIAAENYYNLTSSSIGDRIMAPAGTIGIAGAFSKGTNNFTFTNSTVNYNANGPQIITPFIADPMVLGKTYENLMLSNNGVKSLIGNTDVESALTLSNTIQLSLVSSYLTLKSSASNTARVAPVSATASISYTTGRFVIERYFPARRAWRLITAPVTVDGAKTFFNSWQAGGNNNLSNAGNGTYISGLGETPANGLDVSPQHNYSLKTFNQATSGFDGVGDTKGSAKLISGTAGVALQPDNVGYFMFVRGDRTINNTQPFNPAVVGNATTLRDTGKIQMQNYVFNCNTSTGINKYTLIGNPYASPVDFASLTKSSGVANKFWAWDPSLNGANGVGGYAIVDLALGKVTTVPAGDLTTQTNIIQSKQAFLVETIGLSPTVTFKETDKSPANNLNLFKPLAPPSASLIANLYIVNADGISLADGVMAQYRNDFSIGEDKLDANKFTNVNETFSIRNGNNYFMLERRPFLQQTDTVFFNLSRAREFNYCFNIILNNILQHQNSIAYLNDRYLKTAAPLNMDGSTWVDFNVDGNAESFAPNRFYIVFKKVADYAGIKATVIRNDVNVEWSVENETAIHSYEVERSIDGISFISLGTINANGSKNYSWLDNFPAPGVYYYRIKANSNYSANGLSEIAKVNIVKNSPALFVFPNPVTTGNIQLQLNEREAGTYKLRLISKLGQIIMAKKFMHTGGTITHNIETSSIQANGLYDLEVTEPNRKISIIKVLINRK